MQYFRNNLSILSHMLLVLLLTGALVTAFVKDREAFEYKEAYEASMEYSESLLRTYGVVQPSYICKSRR